MPSPVLCVGDVTDPKFGFSPGTIMTGSATVMVGSGRMVATMGSAISPHGNTSLPNLPGFNPTCAVATVATGSTTVMVEMQPLATLDTGVCTCGLHSAVGPGEWNIVVGP